MGLSALAVTDRNTLAGLVRAHSAAKEHGLKLLIGAEIVPVDAPSAVVWATDRASYGRLARLITIGRRRAVKGDCRLTVDDLAEHSEGLLAGLPLASSEWRTRPDPLADMGRFREIFGGRCYGLIERDYGPDDRRLLTDLHARSIVAGIPPVAAGNVYYHDRGRRPLHDVVSAVRLKCTVAELGEHRFFNGERHLKSPATMAELFAAFPGTVERTMEIADRCRFSLDELRYEYPEELCPPGRTATEYLTELTWAGARNRYPAGVPDKVRSLIEHELALIADLRYEAYFLTVWDLVRFARQRGILCQGRGSAANSAVCFCLEVTSVDPERIDVLFERFISKERNEAPDIDVDFEHERREEVLQYVYEKYGRDRAGMTGVVTTYQVRSAVRDVGKALGLTPDCINVVANAVGHRHDESLLAARFREVGFSPTSPVGKRLIGFVTELIGFPRHLSQHVGGMVVTRGPLSELVPIENAAMEDRTVVQWDKDDLDALGILKVDILALGMLSAIRRCFDLIADHYGRRWTLATVPSEDPAVYEMICRADTVGVFQIESRAQMSMLPRLQPRCFYDLVIEVAIVRPGPIQGKMVHPYLRRRSGQEKVEYPSEAVRSVLDKTLGVPIFQEQAMRLAVVAAGFTPGEADQLRRAMGAWRRRGVMDQFRRKLVDGMLRNGYTEEFADRVFQQIQGFGEYGFPESHAASFALLVYVSAWLKCHYPDVFAAAMVNSQPMGFYAPAQLIADARRHGVPVRSIDVNSSRWDCTLESSRLDDGGDPHRHRYAVRLGLRLVGGLTEEQGRSIEQARESGPFLSFDDFVRRTDLSAGAMKRLSHADALRSLHESRRPALWRSLPGRERSPLFSHTETAPAPDRLPAMSALDEVLADYGSAGLSLRRHPIAFLRSLLDQRRVVTADRLPETAKNSWVRVAGVVLMRQRPGTAKGITFVTLEDETGVVNLIIRPDVWERYRRAARSAVIMFAEGRLQREHDVVHVLVNRVEDYSRKMQQFDADSRDFR